MKVFARLFQKAAGYGAEPHNTPFFWFFFCGYLLKKRTKTVSSHNIPHINHGLIDKIPHGCYNHIITRKCEIHAVGNRGEKERRRSYDKLDQNRML